MKKNIFLLSSPIIIFLLFIPICFFEFAHHDQYRYFNKIFNKTGCFDDTQFKGLFYDLGRPIQALIECSQYMYSNSLFDLTVLRFVSILLLCIISFLLYKYKLNYLDNFPRLIFSISIVSLPGFMYLVEMANISVLFTFILILLADLCNKYTNIKIRFVQFILLIFALFTYPLAATSYLTFIFINLFQSIYLNKNFKLLYIKELLRSLLPFFLASISFILFTKFILHPFVSYIPNESSYSFNLVKFNLDRINFGLEYIFKASQLNLIDDFYGLKYIVLIFAILSFRFYNNKLNLIHFIFNSIASVLIIILLALPISITNFNETLFRTTIPLSIFLIYKISLIFTNKIKFIYNFFISLIFFSFLLLSFIKFYYSIINSRDEFRFLEYGLNNFTNDKLLIVRNFNRQDAFKSFNGFTPVGDEFNIDTTFYSQEEIGFMLNLALHKKYSGNFNLISCDLNCDITRNDSKINNIYYLKSDILDANNSHYYFIDYISNSKQSKNNIYFKSISDNFNTPYNAEHLHTGKQPGWHSSFLRERGITLDIDLQNSTHIEYIKIFGQDNFSNRLPSSFSIYDASDEQNIKFITSYNNNCNTNFFNLNVIKTNSLNINATKLKIIFYGTCNDQKLMVIRKIEFL